MKYLVVDYYQGGFLSPVVLREDDCENAFDEKLRDKLIRTTREYKSQLEYEGIRSHNVVFLHDLTEEELEQWKRLTEKMTAIYCG